MIINWNTEIKDFFLFQQPIPRVLKIKNVYTF